MFVVYGCVEVDDAPGDEQQQAGEDAHLERETFTRPEEGPQHLEFTPESGPR